MGYLDAYNLWKNDEFFDSATRTELNSLIDQKEIEDRFYKELEFGTGGLRGLMGAGTNRVNKYTVGKATAGLGNYLIDTYGREACENRGVVIGYDTRNNSQYFAKITADILSGMGIKVYLHAHARPTPQLSFSVIFWNALAGVVITASHNPKEYNGYKIYDPFGCQLVPWKAEEIKRYVAGIPDYRSVNFEGNGGLIFMADVTDNFVAAVMKQSRYDNREAKAQLNIVYTPLHGTGSVPVQKVLRLDGFENIWAVAEQVVPDGNFPTVVTPNPEDERALKLGIEQAERTGGDLVLATDPDSDRVGAAVKTDDGYVLMTGNQIGALLMDFVLENTKLTKKSAVVKTVVTSELGGEIARKKGLKVFSTLTGFKYIGEKIQQFEQRQDQEFVFGYEESYGYLVGTHARDKDAVVSVMLICEMAASLKAKGKTLLDRMNEIYEEYGYYRDALESFTFKGKDGLEKINSLMSELRDKEPPFDDIKEVIDYSKPVKSEEGYGHLPASNVLKYILTNGSWIAVRPSGTEPKIKIYYNIKEADQNTAEKKLMYIQTRLKNKLGLEKVRS